MLHRTKWTYQTDLILTRHLIIFLDRAFRRPRRLLHVDPSRVPGWSEFAEPARQKSLLWHRIWHSGRPRSGHVADIMRRTRAKYHNAVRQVKRYENIIV
jgi:hypothetical protein